jgi:molybdopterin-guanine dinucleotide biosynthesis protein A
MSSNPSVAGFVLAGGRSSRMGVDKARLKVDDQPLLLRTVNLLRAHLDWVAVVGPVGRYEFIQDPVVPDHWPGKGPLAALLTGLEHSSSEWNVFLACDLPLLDGRFIDLLIRSATASQSQAVIPRTRDGWQPLCAAYHRTCAFPIRAALGEGELTVVSVLPRLRVEVINEEHLARAGLGEEIFENLNGPEDWERIMACALIV